MDSPYFMSVGLNTEIQSCPCCDSGYGKYIPCNLDYCLCLPQEVRPINQWLVKTEHFLSSWLPSEGRLVICLISSSTTLSYSQHIQSIIKSCFNLQAFKNTFGGILLKFFIPRGWIVETKQMTSLKCRICLQNWIQSLWRTLSPLPCPIHSLHLLARTQMCIWLHTHTHSHQNILSHNIISLKHTHALSLSLSHTLTLTYAPTLYNTYSQASPGSISQLSPFRKQWLYTQLVSRAKSAELESISLYPLEQ